MMHVIITATPDTDQDLLDKFVQEAKSFSGKWQAQFIGPVLPVQTISVTEPGAIPDVALTDFLAPKNSSMSEKLWSTKVSNFCRIAVAEFIKDQEGGVSGIPLERSLTLKDLIDYVNLYVTKCPYFFLYQRRIGRKSIEKMKARLLPYKKHIPNFDEIKSEREY